MHLGDSARKYENNQEVIIQEMVATPATVFLPKGLRVLGHFGSLEESGLEGGGHRKGRNGCQQRNLRLLGSAKFAVLGSSQCAGHFVE